MRTSRRKRQRTSRNPGRRRHRRTSRNPIPRPPSASNYRAWWHWISKTFAPGTTVMAREPLLGYLHTPNTQTRPKYVVTTVDIPVGAKGVVTDCHQSTNEGTYPSYIRMEFFPSWQVPAGTWALVYVSGDDRDAVEDMIEALDDNWGPAPRPLGRHALPRAQRSWLKPNIPVGKLTVPPRRVLNPLDMVLQGQWIATTYAPGTPVKLLRRDLLAFGTRGVVVTIRQHGPVVVRILDARDREGIPVSSLVGKEYDSYNPLDELEPMVDNWASASPQRLQRYQLPRTQRSWLKPNASRRGLEAAVEAMRLYLGSVDRTAVRDQQRMFARVTRAVKDIAAANGMRVEDAWEQVEREARRRGVRLAVPGKDI